jgi:hypothetical protein
MSMLSIKVNVVVKKDKKIEIQLPDEISEGEHELVLVIDKPLVNQPRPLSEFSGTINWPVDGLEFQNQIRTEWK